MKLSKLYFNIKMNMMFTQQFTYYYVFSYNYMNEPFTRNISGTEKKTNNYVCIIYTKNKQLSTARFTLLVIKNDYVQSSDQYSSLKNNLMSILFLKKQTI